MLDFYVHESLQRQGVGKKLFLYMLQVITTCTVVCQCTLRRYQRESKGAHQVAYDRPSPKLLSFLRKHFGLNNYTPQENNYVVFKQYFTSSGISAQTEDQRFIPVSRRPLSSRGRSSRGQGCKGDDMDERTVMPSLDEITNSDSSPSDVEEEEEIEEPLEEDISRQRKRTLQIFIDKVAFTRCT